MKPDTVKNSNNHLSYLPMLHNHVDRNALLFFSDSSIDKCTAVIRCLLDLSVNNNFVSSVTQFDDLTEASEYAVDDSIRILFVFSFIVPNSRARQR